jgi:hypothetical protein
MALFDHGRLNSFASMAAHGTAFLNLHYGMDEVYLVEDIVHQSGHIVFSTATVDRSGLFEVSPDTTLRELVGTEGDERTLYVALHGLVTEAMMCETLSNCYSNGVFSGRQHQEVLGRLAYASKRMYLDLRLLNRLEIFGPVGQELFAELVSGFRQLRERYGDLINQLDVSNQSYNFSWQRFSDLNRPARVNELIGLST